MKWTDWILGWMQTFVNCHEVRLPFLIPDVYHKPYLLFEQTAVSTYVDKLTA